MFSKVILSTVPWASWGQVSERPSDSFLIKVNSSSCLGGSAKVVRGGVRPAAHGPHAAQDGYEFSPTQNCKFNLFCCHLFIYLFIFRERGREGEKRETSMCGCLLCTPFWGPGLQSRHVPWLGIQPVTLGFTGQHSIHWATPARA